MRRWLAGCAAALVLGCDGRPAPTTPSSPVPAGRIQPSLESLSISGPATIAPGAAAPFVVTARLSDGTTASVTEQATWLVVSETTRGVVTIAPIGQFVGGGSGEATVRALYGGRSATVMVMVIPTGTYRLVGQVLETGVAVSDATVAIVAGQGAGLSTVTDYTGQYRLYGVAGDVQVRVTKDGYATASRSLAVTAHEVLDLSVAPANPYPNLNGSYSLSITADVGCHDKLPADVWQRRYTATIAQNGPSIQVRLSGANFVVSGELGSGFVGRIEPAGISFWLNDGYYAPHYPDVVEALGADRFLIINIGGLLKHSGADFIGSAGGQFYINSTPRLWWGGKILASCINSRNQVELRK